MRRNFAIKVLSAGLAFSLLACANPAHRTPEQSVIAPGQSAHAWSAEDLRRLDGLVTPTTIFIDESQRVLYELLPPAILDDYRTYVFQLKPQTGMVEGRHFQQLTISWIRVAGRTPPAEPSTASASTGGPNGGLLSITLPSRDGRYELTVSEAMRLPASLQIPELDLSRIAADLLRQYDQSTQRR